MEGIDRVFHLAGKAHALSEISEDPEEYERVNVVGTRRLIEAATAAGVERFVYFSSVKAMGEETAEGLDERHPPKPRTAYGRTKLMAEELVSGFSRSGRHASILRLPLVYGVGNKGNLYRMVAAIDRGLFPPIPDTNNRRSMVHVSNVVDAALLAAARREANGQTFIVTDAREYSTRELYEAIRRGLGHPVPRWSVPPFAWRAAGRVGDVAGLLLGRRSFVDSDAVTKLLGSAWYSSAKITNELGYSPRVGLAEGLPEILAWYRAERAARSRVPPSLAQR
jgi:nucleoside-diphosphate-sugar epimerase